MLIAVSAEGPGLSGAVSTHFEACRFLLLVETDSLAVEALENTGVISLAETVVGRDCEAVITGSLAPESFGILADAMVTRYKGDGLSAAEALDRMDRNTLEYIRNADENDVCHGDHGGGECNCGEDDD